MLINSDNIHKIIFGENIENHLISVKILDKYYKLPSEVCLLRGLHYLTIISKEYEISLRKHCWSGTCENCKCKFIDKQLGEIEGLACQMEIDPELEITELPKTMEKS